MTKEEILDKNGAGIYRWGDFDTQEDSYVFKEGSLTREAALKAMQEYATHQLTSANARIKELEGQIEKTEKDMIDICLKISENMRFDTETQAGHKFVAIDYDELKYELECLKTQPKR